MLSYEHKLKQREDTINDLERDASYFSGKNYCVDDGIQNNLVVQVSQKYFDSTWNQEGFWRSKGFFNQYLFFNHTNVNSVSSKKYPGKPAGVRFSTDFFLCQKRQRSLNTCKPTHNKYLYYI